MVTKALQDLGVDLDSEDETVDKKGNDSTTAATKDEANEKEKHNTNEKPKLPRDRKVTFNVQSQGATIEPGGEQRGEKEKKKHPPTRFRDNA